MLADEALHELGQGREEGDVGRLELVEPFLAVDRLDPALVDEHTTLARPHEEPGCVLDLVAVVAPALEQERGIRVSPLDDRA